MPRAAGLITVIVLLLSLAGCGGKNNATSTAPAAGVTTSSASSTSASNSPPVRSVTYTVSLATPNPPARAHHRAPVIPKGSGRAFISIRAATNELCWEFEQLQHLVAQPDEAALVGRIRGLGITSTPLSGIHEEYIASGCASEPPFLLGGMIELHPHNFELVVANRKLGLPLRGRL